MRELIFQMMVTLDGYFEGPNREIDWHNVDAEFNDYAIDLLNNVDVLLFGRVTYQLMASYWPSSAAMTNDPIVAEKMNSLSKIVFSKTLEKAEWNNTRLLKENVGEEITMLKRQHGKDMAIFGSSDLALTLVRLGLIDEFRIFVNPVVLGSGKPVFRGIHDKLNLKLVESKTFRSGNVLLRYHPVEKEPRKPT
jgi:dihydrofolate reductase